MNKEQVQAIKEIAIEAMRLIAELEEVEATFDNQEEKGAGTNEQESNNENSESEEEKFEQETDSTIPKNADESMLEMKRAYIERRNKLAEKELEELIKDNDKIIEECEKYIKEHKEEFERIGAIEVPKEEREDEEREDEETVEEAKELFGEEIVNVVHDPADLFEGKMYPKDEKNTEKEEENTEKESENEKLKEYLEESLELYDEIEEIMIDFKVTKKSARTAGNEIRVYWNLYADEGDFKQQIVEAAKEEIKHFHKVRQEMIESGKCTKECTTLMNFIDKTEAWDKLTDRVMKERQLLSEMQN